MIQIFKGLHNKKKKKKKSVDALTNSKALFERMWKGNAFYLHHAWWIIHENKCHCRRRFRLKNKKVKRKTLEERKCFTQIISSFSMESSRHQQEGSFNPIFPFSSSFFFFLKKKKGRESLLKNKQNEFNDFIVKE